MRPHSPSMVPRPCAHRLARAGSALPPNLFARQIGSLLILGDFRTPLCCLRATAVWGSSKAILHRGHGTGDHLIRSKQLSPQSAPLVSLNQMAARGSQSLIRIGSTALLRTGISALVRVRWRIRHATAPHSLLAHLLGIERIRELHTHRMRPSECAVAMS